MHNRSKRVIRHSIKRQAITDIRRDYKFKWTCETSATKQVCMLHKMREYLLQILKKYVPSEVSAISCRFRSCQTWSAIGVLWATFLMMVWETQWQEIVSRTFFKIYTLLITEQLIKHMTKFKVRVSSKHYMKSKPIKCVSSGGVNVAAKHDISMSFIFILAKMKKQSLNLGKQLLWICLKN